MNRFSALGTADIVCVARSRPGKGKARLRGKFRTNASPDDRWRRGPVRANASTRPVAAHPRISVPAPGSV
jgi:hypothetical protein